MSYIALRPAIVCLMLTVPTYGKSEQSSSPTPEAASRSYAQNYKDSALAYCIAKAYAAEPKAYRDASMTASGLDEWSRYDAESSTGEISKLVDNYLAREYHSVHGRDVKLDLLKCFDMYHSKELQDQVKRFVSKPNRSYKQDNP